MEFFFPQAMPSADDVVVFVVMLNDCQLLLCLVRIKCNTAMVAFVLVHLHLLFPDFTNN